MIKNPVRSVITGLGRRSLEDHIPFQLRPNPLATLVGVHDTDPTKEKCVRDIAQELGVQCPPFFTDLQKMLSVTHPDIAIVATPHFTHHEVVSVLLHNGIPVLKEKPFAMNLAQAKELTELIEETGGHMRLCVQRRHHPLYTYGQQGLLHIGAIKRYEANYQLDVQPYDDSWRSQSCYAGGGCVIDMGYHMVDLLYWYFGLPNSIYSLGVNTRNQDLDVEESASALISYENGLVGQLYVSRREREKRESLSVHGQFGQLQLQRDALRVFDSTGNLVEKLERTPAWPSAVADTFYDFVSHLEDKDVVKRDSRAGLEVMAMVEATYRSLKCKVPVDPHTLLAELS